MPEEPSITVITPTHNIIDAELTDEFNILTTLLSRQSYPYVEHLVIDNASDDGTVQLLSDYKSKGYLQFFSEKDGGMYDAYNKGVMHAKGKYVTFINCNDFIHDITSLGEIVELLEEEEADYSFAPAYCISPEGFVFPFEPAILNVFQVMPCARAALVFRKSVIEREGYFDLKFKHMADFDLIMRLALKEYAGVYYEKNYVTCNLSSVSVEQPDLLNAECRQVFIKNLRSSYPLTNEIVDKILKYSDFPKELLEKLALHFDPENREAFMDSCERMKQMRIEAQAALEKAAQEENTEENPASETEIPENNESS